MDNLTHQPSSKSSSASGYPSISSVRKVKKQLPPVPTATTKAPRKANVPAPPPTVGETPKDGPQHHSVANTMGSVGTMGNDGYTDIGYGQYYTEPFSTAPTSTTVGSILYNHHQQPNSTTLSYSTNKTEPPCLSNQSTYQHNLPPQQQTYGIQDSSSIYNQTTAGVPYNVSTSVDTYYDSSQSMDPYSSTSIDASAYQNMSYDKSGQVDPYASPYQQQYTEQTASNDQYGYNTMEYGNVQHSSTGENAYGNYNHTGQYQEETYEDPFAKPSQVTNLTDPYSKPGDSQQHRKPVATVDPYAKQNDPYAKQIDP
uniref:Uncharacterized protein n=2 Tax=Cacopsylla melanoneura TaxID=428564 RepID=A0A8D9E1W0_9HEMI